MDKEKLKRLYLLLKRHWNDLSRGQKVVIFYGLLLSTVSFSSRKKLPGFLILATTLYLWVTFINTNRVALFRIGVAATVDPDNNMLSWRFPPKPGALWVFLMPKGERR